MTACAWVHPNGGATRRARGEQVGAPVWWILLSPVFLGHFLVFPLPPGQARRG